MNNFVCLRVDIVNYNSVYDAVTKCTWSEGSYFLAYQGVMTNTETIPSYIV